MVWRRLFWASCAAIFSLSAGVERGNFKTCSDSSFCGRNRLQAGEVRSDRYTVQPESLKVSAEKVIAIVHDKKDERTLDLELLAVADNTVRFRVKESQPVRVRYEPVDVLLPLESETWTETERTDTWVMLAVTGTQTRVKLQFRPLMAEFFSGDTLLVSLNSRNLMNFEQTKVKPEPIPEPEKNENGTYLDAEAENAWRKRQEELELFKPEKYKSFEDSRPHGPTSIALDALFHDMQYVYGLPSHADSLALKTTEATDPYRLYNLDVFEYEIGNPMALYGSIPMVVAHSVHHTVGLFWLNASETWVDIINAMSAGKLLGKLTHWISESGNIDLFVMCGPKPQDVARQYSRLTGTVALPPRFSLGYHQCRWNYNSVKDCLDVDAKFDEHNIPYDVLWLDIEHTEDKKYFTWQPTNFNNPEELQEHLANKSRKLVTIVDPHIKRDGNYYVHKEAQEKGLYVKNAAGKDYEGWCWPGSSSWPDFTSEEGRTFWGDQFEYSNYKGSTPILHIWNDMNEPSVFNGPEITMPKDNLHAGNVEHREVHNMYGLLTHRATVEGLYRRMDGKQRPFVLSRAYFASTQRYGAVWTGDNGATWAHLASAVPMILSANLAGLPFIGADIGGFFGNPEPELLTRWYQAGIFYPFFRAHAHIDSNRREPWLLPEEHMARVRDALRLRYAMLPLWYTAFYHSHITGSPVVRPLWWDYFQDEKAFAMEDGFLIGGDVLANPVYEKDATTKDIYFPAQIWYDLVTDSKVIGPAQHSRPVDMDTIVAYQRGGSVLPLQLRPRRSSALQHADPYTLRVALDANSTAEGRVYIDDGESYEYQQGKYAYWSFRCTDSVLQATNNDLKGTLAPSNRLERVIVLGLESKPDQVTLKTSSLARTLLFNFDAEKQMLTIKDPAVPLISDWSISF